VILGLLGSVLLAVGGFGVGAPPARLDVPLALPMCVAGVLLLLVGWWQLRSAPVRAVLRTTGLWSLPLLVAAPLFSRDVYAYAGQAHLVLSGLDPYTHGPTDAPGPLSAEVDAVWSDAPSPYGPVFLRLAAGVVAVTGERPLLAAYGLRLLAVLGLGLLAWGLLRLVPVDPGRALWLGVANPLLLLHGVAGAHNDLLMVGLLVAGLSCGPVLGAVLITLAALVKAPAVIGLAFLPLLAARRVRAALLVAATAAVTAVSVTAVSGLGWGWVSTLDAGSARRSLLSVTTGVGAAVGAVDAAHVVGLVLAALLAGALLLRADRIGPVRALGLALLGIVLLLPTVQPWYLLWGVVVLAPVVSRREARALAAGCAVLCLLVLPSGRHLIRPSLYGVPMLLVGVAVTAVGVRGVREARTG
jgi:hypothetical protein